MKKLLSILTIASIVFIAGCKKDKFVEVVGVCPVVVSTNPANGSTGVPLDQVITAKFNEKINPATVTQASFTLTGSVVAGTVTYNDSTATFTPASPLTNNHTYTGRITTAIKDYKGNALQTDYVWTFSTGTTLSPVVIGTNPVNNATGVALNKIITATFSVPMDDQTITATTFTLKQGATAVAGTVSYSGTTATFTPTDPLSVNTVYTGTISTGAKNVPGTALADKYVWKFTTGSIMAPSVISTDPVNNATGVVVDKIISATFSAPMDPPSLNAATFTIKQGTTPVAGTVSLNGATASFTPAVFLLSGSVYTATITTGAKDASGTPLANGYVWTFTVMSVTSPIVISSDPINNATGVALNKKETVSFSMPMDPLTINTTTFTLKQGTTPVTGTVSYNGTTATFNPDGNLMSNANYTATITTGAKNIAGTPLASDFVWHFSTSTTLGPVGVNLRSVGDFGIIAGVGVSNAAGFSVIRNMDVGISPGVRSSIVGFPPAIVVNGSIFASDDIAPPGVPAMLTQAKQDLTDAYLFAEGATAPAPATIAGDIGGTTLAPGIYKSTSTLLIQSGNLTLDAQGDANAVWIFQIASDFTTVGGAGGSVILSGGAKAKNVFWQTGSSATIGDYTSFNGTVLALTSITMNAGATATGRMLARNGSVVLTSTNIIEKP